MLATAGALLGYGLALRIEEHMAGRNTAKKDEDDEGERADAGKASAPDKVKP